MTGKSAADTSDTDTWVAGVDGCPGGWLVAFVRAAASEVRLRIVPQFAEVLAATKRAAVIAIDIPIGLPAHAGRGGRAPERLVRPLLGERQSSVFSVPSRAALAAADYREACAVALATSDPPRKISKQLFMIAPKIREVDQSLRMDPHASDRVFEVHPELAFWRLNADRALAEPKKIKGRCYDRGLAVRRRADGRLRRHGRVTAVERRPVRAAVPAAFGKSPGQRPGTKRPGRGVSPQG